MACAQCWGDVLCFLFTGPDPPARTSAPSEICKGRTGHEQVRRNKSELSPVLPTETTLWCQIKSRAVDWILSMLYVWLCSTYERCWLDVFQRWCPTEPDHCSALPARSWGADATTERRAHPRTVSSFLHTLNSLVTKKTRGTLLLLLVSWWCVLFHTLVMHIDPRSAGLHVWTNAEITYS